MFNIFNFIRFIGLRKTTKSRQVLRNQWLNVAGKKMYPMHYLEYVASQLPTITKKGQPIDHLMRLKHFYYTYDLPGVNYYIHVTRKQSQKLIKKSKVQGISKNFNYNNTAPKGKKQKSFSYKY